MDKTTDNQSKSFFNDVYEVVKLIPPGRVTSYGAIARYLNAKGAARQVGWAMNGAGKLKGIPAHRVVNSQGILTGMDYFDKGHSMAQLLLEEGIEIENNKVKNFKSYFWDPSSELL